ncbi:chromosome segregation DNA-binding protein [Pelagirhabdus alkalitolerans]|uniref:Chromosome segregation DNA-binding protein n=1 Tax=Pelagirhabdus alkalitolerans TaxID=1612202 RepID=A0A1G6LBL4_9BACI|nr:ParB/RepB/Spo0J family partition protein [Pelagirhabdus alkalitolerans]SDC40619.1 chromosome segregation DNA-binding protein [Pelagirhabdus alkalitolerans]
MARGLGKGINAFFPDLEEQEKNEQHVIEIDVTACRPNPYQPRKTFDVDAIDELKQSIMTHGIIQPLLVRESIKGYEIIAGERRFRAAKEAGLETVPAIVKEMDDKSMMELALLENLQRENLTSIEEAQAYVNLMESYQLTQEELAKRLGKSRSYIANVTRLLHLPTQVRAMIGSGELSMGHGRTLLGLKDEKKCVPLAEKITKEKLNVRQVESIVQRLNNEKAKEKQKKKKKDIFLEERESTLRDRLGTNVKIQKGRNKGKIEIDFFSNEDLDRIMEQFNL